MSQQINLILPELRRRFDWLALPVVAGVAGGLLVLVVGVGALGNMSSQALRDRDSELSQSLALLQQQVQTLGQSVASRKESPLLAQELELQQLAVEQRREVVKVISQGKADEASSYSVLMEGFGRQVKDGVWLTAFGFQGQAVEIRGRLTDSSLLPAYIAKLNDEPAFSGRKFAALDMKAVDPVQEKGPAAQAASDNKPKPGPRFVEFALTTERMAAKGGE
ncbi:PilN domain-containing protein [Azonexus sp. IMCC34839]|uniref:PilN domain-containing protein n=1 Tax=Azonexus sp. IMCC34839 TaxID=3133695 RepID=UPI003999FC62